MAIEAQDDGRRSAPRARRPKETARRRRFADRGRRAIRCGRREAPPAGFGHPPVQAAQSRFSTFFFAASSMPDRTARERVYRRSCSWFAQRRAAAPRRPEFPRRSTLRNPLPKPGSRDWRRIEARAFLIGSHHERVIVAEERAKESSAASMQRVKVAASRQALGEGFEFRQEADLRDAFRADLRIQRPAVQDPVNIHARADGKPDSFRSASQRRPAVFSFDQRPGPRFVCS